MKQVLVCNSCAQELTNPLCISENIVHADSLSLKADAIQVGVGQRCHVWLNEKDVLARVELVPNISKFMGCCGINGGPNSRCKCGAIVGSAYADCMGPPHFELIENATHWVEYVSNAIDRQLAKQQRFYENSRAKRKKYRHKK